MEKEGLKPKGLAQLVVTGLLTSIMPVDVLLNPLGTGTLNPLGIGTLVYADWCTRYDIHPQIWGVEASPGFLCEVFLEKEKEKESIYKIESPVI